MLPSEGSDAGSIPAESTAKLGAQREFSCALGVGKLLCPRQESNAAALSRSDGEARPAFLAVLGLEKAGRSCREHKAKIANCFAILCTCAGRSHVACDGRGGVEST